MRGGLLPHPTVASWAAISLWNDEGGQAIASMERSMSGLRPHLTHATALRCDLLRASLPILACFKQTSEQGCRHVKIASGHVLRKLHRHVDALQFRRPLDAG